MDNKNGLFVGIDICNDFTQLTYFDTEASTSKSIGKDGKEEYLIPTKMAFDTKRQEWIIGEDTKIQGNEVLEVIELFKNIDEEITALGNNYSKSRLAEIYIKHLLEIINEPIYRIGFTFDILTKEILNLIQGVMENLGIDYTMVDHDEALFYYATDKKQATWVNDIFLFELSDTLSLKQLSIDRNESPVTGRIVAKEISGLNRKKVKENREESEAIFYNLVSMELNDKIISTIYTVGRGFIDDWADNVLKKLSPGKRVFRGQNLYAIGACMAAVSPDPDFLLLGKDRISVEISINAVKNGKQTELALLEPSKRWYEAYTSIELLIKGESELGIKFKNYETKKTERRFISFSGMNMEDKDITRIRLSMHFTDKNTCVIKASDLGFGIFTPTTNRVWELTWEK